MQSSPLVSRHWSGVNLGCTSEQRRRQMRCSFCPSTAAVTTLTSNVIFGSCRQRSTTSSCDSTKATIWASLVPVPSSLSRCSKMPRKSTRPARIKATRLEDRTDSKVRLNFRISVSLSAFSECSCLISASFSEYSCLGGAQPQRAGHNTSRLSTGTAPLCTSR